MLAFAGLWQTARRRIKSDKHLYPLALKLRGWLLRRSGEGQGTASEE
jgi:hypothetical protein